MTQESEKKQTTETPTTEQGSSPFWIVVSLIGIIVLIVAVEIWKSK